MVFHLSIFCGFLKRQVLKLYVYTVFSLNMLFFNFYLKITWVLFVIGASCSLVEFNYSSQSLNFVV